MELDIKSKREKIANLEGDYIKMVLEDPNETDPYQKVIDLFTGDSSPRAQRYTISALMHQGKTGDALNALGSYSGDANTDHFVAFKTIELDLLQRGQNWFQMSAGEKSTLEQIAADKTKRGYEAARSVLSLINDDQPLPFIKPYNNSAPAPRMTPLNQWSPEMAPKLLEAYPQPANTEMYIMADLPEEFESAAIKLVDVTGRTVDYIELGISPLQQISVAQYASGMYVAELILNGESIESLKVNIIH